MVDYIILIQRVTYIIVIVSREIKCTETTMVKLYSCTAVYI